MGFDFKKGLLISSLLLILCVSLGAVSAADNADVDISNVDNDIDTVDVATENDIVKGISGSNEDLCIKDVSENIQTSDDEISSLGASKDRLNLTFNIKGVTVKAGSTFVINGSIKNTNGSYVSGGKYSIVNFGLGEVSNRNGTISCSGEAPLDNGTYYGLFKYVDVNGYEYYSLFDISVTGGKLYAPIPSIKLNITYDSFNPALINTTLNLKAKVSYFVGSPGDTVFILNNSVYLAKKVRTNFDQKTIDVECNMTLFNPGTYQCKVVYLGYSGRAGYCDQGSTTAFKLTVIEGISMTIRQFNSYVSEKYITVTLSKPISGKKITLKFSNGETVNVTTDSSGVARYDIPFCAGNYSVTASAVSTSSLEFKTATLNNIVIATKSQESVSMVIEQFGDDYTNKYITVTLSKPIKGKEITLKFSNGETVNVATNSSGVARYDIPFCAGNYSVTASASSDVNYKFVSSTLNNIIINAKTLHVNNNSVDALKRILRESKSGDTIILNGAFKIYESNRFQIMHDLNIIGVNNAVIDFNNLNGSFDIFDASVNFINLSFINDKSCSIISESDMNYPINVINCTFINCTKGSITTGLGYHSINVINCTFINCNNGAIEWANYISNCTFINCKAKEYGGVVYKGNISNCTFINCSSPTNNPSGILACAYAVNCTFINNTKCYYVLLDSMAKSCYFEKTNVVWYDYDLNNCVFKSKLQVSVSGSYYRNTWLTIKLFDAGNNLVTGESITIKFSNGKKVTLKTNSTGVLTYRIPFDPGTYSATVYPNSNKFNCSKVSVNFKILKISAKFRAPKFSTTYSSGKYFEIKASSSNNLLIANLKIKLKVYTGKKYKTVYVTTNSRGYAYYSASKLSIGKHKVIISSTLPTKYFVAKSITSYITIKKATPKITTSNRVHGYFDFGYFRITVENKATNVAIKGVKLKIKVYTGKKYKVYYRTTNKYGDVLLSTNYLKYGTHKVIISTVSKYTYTKSIKSYIKIEPSVEIRTPPRSFHYIKDGFITYAPYTPSQGDIWIGGGVITAKFLDMAM